MSKTATRFLAVACLFFVSLSIQAQENRFVKEADNAYNNEAYYTAIDLYKKAYAKESNIDEKARMIFMIGESYRQVLDLEQQIVWYDKALKANYDKPEAYKHLGEAYRQLGNFPEAILNYERYLEKMGADPEAEKVLAAMEASKKWMEKPGRYQVNNEVILNSKEYDFAPSWAARDYNTVYFTSSRQGAEGIEIDERTGENFQDILKSTRDNKGKWSEPLRLPNRINGGQNDGGSVFNSTFDVMYFTRCESEKDVNKGCDIYRVKKVGADWGQPEKLPLKPAPEKNGPVYSVGHPALNKDETMMIFAGDIPGSLGGKDLFMVTYDKAADSWGKPVNLGAEINTKQDEMFPFLREDGTLFFASEGHPGMGGLDIFSASSTGENQWGNVTNMKPPINSVSHDFGIIFEGVEERGFFTSNREGGKGQDDLYTFTLPALEFALEGVVYDKEASTPVPQAKVKVVGNDGSAFEIETDDNGAFRFAENGDQRYINPETSYSIEVSKPDYLVARDKISTVGIKESTTFAKEYLITFTAPDVAIEFPEVRYAYNKAELLVDAEVNSKDSLNYLYDVLVENPTIIIELQAHTDSRGNDKYNQELSQRRAQSCVDYLIERGIPRDRMRAKGYGESRLRISDAQIAKMATNEEKEAAHQKNRRTEFTVLSFDYVPKEAVEEGNN